MTSHSNLDDNSLLTKQRINAQRNEINHQIQSVLSTSDCLPPSKAYYTRSTGDNLVLTKESNLPGDKGYKVKLAKIRDMGPPGFLEIIVFSRGHPVVWSNAALVLIGLVVSFFLGGGPLPAPVLLCGLLVLGVVDYALCRWYLRNRKRFTYHPHREHWGKGIIFPDLSQNDKDSKRQHSFQAVKMPMRPGLWAILSRNPTHPVIWMNAILLILTALLFRALWHQSLFTQLLFLAGLGVGSMLDCDVTMKWLRERPYRQGSLRNWFGYGVIW
ncbi:hypothetical protein BDV06DRAFT_204886 [Aspergillus oleicola]